MKQAVTPQGTKLNGEATLTFGQGAHQPLKHHKGGK